jgi:uncharacterized protein (TIGR02246 family)
MIRLKLILAIFVLSGTLATMASATSDPKTEIDAFNQNYLALHQKMDTPAILALWAEDGVDLMPGENPLIGRAAITEWLNAILAKMPGTKVTQQEMTFHDIRVTGDWATEWATEHQVAQSPEGKIFDGYGKMALILHRMPSGEWKVQQEMWNDMPKP